MFTATALPNRVVSKRELSDEPENLLVVPGYHRGSPSRPAPPYAVCAGPGASVQSDRLAREGCAGRRAVRTGTRNGAPGADVTGPGRENPHTTTTTTKRESP
ncbi:hypothetical protein [Streptomyces sp. B21-083]|uniref:hypothetical protein n=1 Tax=Streptomyces sp. B21-083 TaxID=3039410 RepID=UPI002FF2B7B2